MLSLLQPCWSGGPAWEAGSESSISLTRTFPSISCPAVGRLLVQSAPFSTEPPSLQGYQGLGRRAPAHTAAPKINLQPFSLLFSQGSRCVGQVMTPCLGPCIHSHRMPVPAPCLFFKTSGDIPTPLGSPSCHIHPSELVAPRPPVPRESCHSTYPTELMCLPTLHWPSRASLCLAHSKHSVMLAGAWEGINNCLLQNPHFNLLVDGAWPVFCLVFSIWGSRTET